MTRDRDGGGAPEPAWRPSATRARLALRAELRNRIRAFFSVSDVLEVDTPVLVRHLPPEPHIRRVRAHAQQVDCYLRTSPESAMKRLLAAGVGDCWQLGPVFRDSEHGDWHQPEFRMLEWYRLDIDHHELMAEVEALLVATLQGIREVPAARHLTYREAFQQHAGLDPFADSTEQLRAHAQAEGAAPELSASDRTAWLDWLLATVVVPRLPRETPVFIHAWPSEQAALARIEPGPPATAARFELFWHGVELANGFHELVDPHEQRERFQLDSRADAPSDALLLAALAFGVPDCAGVALGFDRLVAVAAGAGSLSEVIAFPFDRV